MKYGKMLVITLAVFSTVETRIYAYEDDTHYYLTYYLARKVGYAPNQAHQLASANLSIDYDKYTEPFQKGAILNPWGDAQTPRFKFHAMVYSKTYDDAYSKARDRGLNEFDAWAEAVKIGSAELDKRQQEFWLEAKQNGNPGAFLHFTQDRFSHNVSKTRLGHMAHGHTPDYLSYKPAKSREMVNDTIKHLERFMHESLPHVSNKLNRSEIDEVLSALMKALPVPNELTRENFETEGLIPGGPRNFQKKAAIAKEVIEKYLKEKIPDHILYTFDKDGKPTSKGWELKGFTRSKPGSLRVKAVDDSTGKFLDGATIAVSPTGKSRTVGNGSTKDGVATLDLNPPSAETYNVVIMMKGYRTANATVTVEPNDSACIAVRLIKLLGTSSRVFALESTKIRRAYGFNVPDKGAITHDAGEKIIAGNPGDIRLSVKRFWYTHSATLSVKVPDKIAEDEEFTLQSTAQSSWDVPLEKPSPTLVASLSLINLAQWDQKHDNGTFAKPFQPGGHSLAAEKNVKLSMKTGRVGDWTKDGIQYRSLSLTIMTGIGSDHARADVTYIYKEVK